MQAYLTWEIELANQIKRDDTVAFGVGEASASSLTWPARGRPRAARPAAAAALRGLRCAGGCAGPALRRLLPPDRLHHRAVLRALRRAVRQCGAGWRGAPVSRLPRRAAGVPARPRRAALRRAGAAADPAVQARRPDRACGGAGAAHGACRRGAAARGGPAGAGAAAPRAAVPTPLQPGGAAGAGGRADRRRPCLPDALVRRRATASLGEKSAAERAAEVAGAFAVRRVAGGAAGGKRVLLVDDVMTSGATANACALLAAVRLGRCSGAARVPDPRLN